MSLNRRRYDWGDFWLLVCLVGVVVVLVWLTWGAVT